MILFVILSLNSYIVNSLTNVWYTHETLHLQLLDWLWWTMFCEILMIIHPIVEDA